MAPAPIPLRPARPASLARLGNARADACPLPDPSAPRALVSEESFDGDPLERNLPVPPDASTPFPGRFETDPVRVLQR